ncbi:MAG: hypothetical protein QW297_07200 [Candidatus Jordarchaeales archaeon]
MVIGCMLLSIGGVPIVTSIVTNVFGDMESLFAGAMSAINSVISEVMKTRVRYVRTERYYLYFSYSGEFMLVLISEVEDPRLNQLADAVLSEVLKVVKDYDPSSLMYNLEMQKLIENVIKDSLTKHLPSISSVTKVADMLIASAESFRGSMKLGLGKIIFLPEELKAEKIDVKVKGEEDVKELVNSFLDGDFERAASETPALFKSDLARILYAKAALKMNSFPPDAKAPPLSRVYSVIMSVEDSLARKLLMAELRRFLEAGTYYEREKLIDENLFELIEKIKAVHSDAGAVYMALALPTGRREIIEVVEPLIGEKHQHVRHALKATLSILKTSILRLEEFEKPSAAVGRIKYELSNVPPGLAEASYNYLLAFQFATLSNLMEKDMDFDAGRELLSDTIKEVEKRYDSLRKLSRNVPCDVLAANYWFTYNALTGMLVFTLHAEEVEKEALKCGKKVAGTIRWLMDVARRNRISVDMYILAMAGMLAAYSRLMFLLGTPILDVAYYVKQLALPELENLWDYSPHHYLHVVIDCLEALGYTASFLPAEAARRSILEGVALGLEEIQRRTRDIPVISMPVALNAIRFYVLCGEEKAKEKARKLAEETSNVNKFLASLAMRSLNIDKAPKKKLAPYDVFT